MKNTNQVSVSAVVFALEEVRSPQAYIRATFDNPSDIHIIRSEGNAIYIRFITPLEVDDSVSLKELASHYITGDSNIIWNFEIQYKSEVPSYAPVA